MLRSEVGKLTLRVFTLCVLTLCLVLSLYLKTPVAYAMTQGECYALCNQQQMSCIGGCQQGANPQTCVEQCNGVFQACVAYYNCPSLPPH